MLRDNREIMKSFLGNARKTVVVSIHQGLLRQIPLLVGVSLTNFASYYSYILVYKNDADTFVSKDAHEQYRG